MSNPLRIAFYRTDRYGHPLGRLGFVSEASRDRTTTGTDTLDITCKTFCDKGDRIIFKDSAGVAREYIITDFDQTRDDEMTLSYHCVNSISELGLHVIEDLRNRDASPGAMLGKALSGTRWISGTVHAGSGGPQDLSFYHTTSLKSVQDVADLFSLEIQTEIVMDSLNSTVLTRRVSLLDRVGSTSPRRFSINHNLPGLERTIDSADVVTRLYGYGKGLEETDANGDPTGGYGRKISFADINGGKPYVEDTAATQKWGIPDANGHITPSMAVVDFSDEDDKQKLLAETRAKLAETSQPKVSYKATVAALGVEGVDRAGIGVGDAVHVIDTTFVPEIRVAGRVLEIKDNLVDPLSDDTEITLGNLQDDYTQQVGNIQNTVNQLWQGVGVWNDAAGLRPSYLDGVINGLNSEMNKTGGYVYMEPGTGITVYNAPKDKNPTMAIQLGGGYFRIANAKNSDGSWKWRTMGTGSGLVADTIVAGTIKGGANTWNLDTGELDFSKGKITSANGSYWDLQHNVFSLANGHLRGDGAASDGTFSTDLDMYMGALDIFNITADQIFIGEKDRKGALANLTRAGMILDDSGKKRNQIGLWDGQFGDNVNINEVVNGALGGKGLMIKADDSIYLNAKKVYIGNALGNTKTIDINYVSDVQWVDKNVGGNVASQITGVTKKSLSINFINGLFSTYIEND